MIFEERIYFDAQNDMQSPYGSENIAQGITVADNHIVMHGPYSQIPSGRWKIIISCHVENSQSCYADACTGGGRVILGQEEWNNGKVEFEIEPKFPVQDFEIRMFASPGSFVRIDEIALIRSNDLNGTRSFSTYQRMGLNLILDRSSLVDRTIITHGTWEPESIETLIDLAYALSNLDNDMLFLDIGSYFGLYSMKMAQTNMFSRIIAFEADQFNYRQLSANLLLNDPKLLIEPNFMAISDAKGTAHFVSSVGKMDGNRGGAGIGNSGVLVEIDKIDNILDEKNKKIVAKIDVEGHEPLVISGMKNVLENNMCALQIESFVHLDLITDMLGKIGYNYIKSVEHDHYFSNF